MPAPDKTTVNLTEPYLKSFRQADGTNRLPDGVDRVRVRDAHVRGFGVSIGRKTITFYLQRRVVQRGRSFQRAITLGVWRDRVPTEWRLPGEDPGVVWTVERARKQASLLVADMKRGLDPRAEHPTTKSSGGGITLRDALDLHVSRMKRGENRRRKKCSPRSIATIEREVKLHLGEYLERPLVDIDRPALRALVAKIESETPRRADANPNNPAGRALSNRVLAHVKAIWNSVDDELGGTLPKCPAPKLGGLDSRDTRVGNEDLPTWYARVMAMRNGVRRDLQLAAMFSAVRSEGLRTLTWADADFDEELIHVAKAKGDRPYTIPMTATLREILERRQRENAIEFKPLGGDHGFVFPSITRERPFRVIAVSEPKEREVDRVTGERVKPPELLGIHASRRTYNSIAMEIEIPQETREALLNHSGRGVNVRSYGRPEGWDRLRAAADRIEAALWSRIRGEHRRGKRGRLRAVDTV